MMLCELPCKQTPQPLYLERMSGLEVFFVAQLDYKRSLGQSVCSILLCANRALQVGNVAPKPKYRMTIN